MIVLNREMPLRILMLQAAIRRGFPEFEEEFQNAQSGFYGERYMDRWWEDMQLAEDHVLLHNFCFRFSEFTNQVDTIFLSRHFALVLEIKNISGRIDIDVERDQMIRTRETGEIEVFRNPVSQVKRHQRALASLIGSQLPIERAIVFMHPKSLIGSVPREEAVFRWGGLESHIRQLFSKYTPHLTNYQLMEMATSLRNYHQLPESKLRLDARKIICGVLCSNCRYKVKMYYIRGQFECAYCKLKSFEPMLEALQDYRLLISEWITNQQFREFMGVHSQDAAARILKKLNLEKIGSKKGSKYKIPISIEIKKE